MWEVSLGGGHAFVLGSGIAGLSIAELLSRNGWKITLLEAAKELGGDASRSTQNWLHTGWLYAALPSSAAMLGCSRALRLVHEVYDSVLPAGVLNVDIGRSGVDYPYSEAGWFSSEAVHYLYALATRELSRIQQLTWRHYLDSVPLRRLRSLGYPTVPLTELPRNLAELLGRWEGSAAGHESYRVVRSTDARINSRRVLDSLLSLLGEKAEVVTSAHYEMEQRDGRTVLRVEGEYHAPDLVVMASGRGLASMLQELGARAESAKISSIRSPIVVLDRALDLPNFIRFTPRVSETINHIKYGVDGLGDVSTIGSYDSHPVDDTPDVASFVRKVCARMGVPLSSVIGSYYGTKTELVGARQRRYNHAVERVNRNTYFALAGKFSQFPLLVHEFAKAAGLRTDIGNDARGRLRRTVAVTTPEHLATPLLAARAAKT